MDLPRNPDAAALDAARLAARVEELQRRLGAKTLELETEARAKDRLDRRVEELSRFCLDAEKAAATFSREAAAAAAELKRRDSEFRDARLRLQALRQKTDGHEAHIDSLRLELDQARERIRELSAVRPTAERAAVGAASPLADVEAKDVAAPGAGEPWQARDEERFVRWLLLGVVLVAAATIAFLFFEG